MPSALWYVSAAAAAAADTLLIDRLRAKLLAVLARQLQERLHPQHVPSAVRYLCTHSSASIAASDGANQWADKAATPADRPHPAAKHAASKRGSV